MFLLQEESLEEVINKTTLENPEVGGAVSFEGRVRNVNKGKKVTLLEYQVYEEMAVLEGRKVVEEALKLFPIKEAICIHRYGQLKIGERAVWVLATSKHRKEAFKACQYIIDEVKKRVPLWKKEFYEDESKAWVECLGCKGTSASV
ncbi:MAG: hypothetical protein CME68_09460 [Halobacteriovoraceae bacterium]|nr:hypothetical protein [Halobacteriovoraceae bacterium]|tara:strand:+ start:3881 stop:4318 length:438 start_codon:yes stop_codon:yes gene_type:complete